MKFVQIESNKNLYRDLESGAILNTDKEQLKTYYAERDQRIKELQEKQSLENKVNKLEDDMSEIKDLLRQLVTRT
jgi:predicted nuclease with TOPRIM domain